MKKKKKSVSRTKILLILSIKRESFSSTKANTRQPNTTVC
jgi:hypothetical protein